jgi:IS5 family transposase
MAGTASAAARFTSPATPATLATAYRGLKKNTAQLFTLFALSNLWMARSKLMGAGA